MGCIFEVTFVIFLQEAMDFIFMPTLAWRIIAKERVDILIQNIKHMVDRMTRIDMLAI